MVYATEEKLSEALEVLSDKINTDVSGDDALKFTQAMLTIANTMIMLEKVKVWDTANWED